MTVQVRPATVADAEAITEIHLVSRAVTMPYLPRLHSDEETLAWITHVVLPSSQVWVAVDDRVLGYAVLEGDLLEGLYLLPEVRRRGIGTALLHHVRDVAPVLRLNVFQRNHEAIAFYRAHGFELTGSSDGSGNEENEPDATYSWRATA
ncbi:GNAT family N-acetyltransferase [Kineosporia sp. NBRC 101731]|uniref:GNAT family N-acetyltransferase n=1 Tax=Kineosporia sp. NBRC 101731 TaxID=3032199 RepID=UPI0024A0DFAA|nr:GNAT family N-acetyltransferase [Kineosporia sp. NBRC 101731]GLY31561.1 hypothetical protein Kisp02_49260 [Kineosporia sp. NBRC 101731]